MTTCLCYKLHTQNPLIVHPQHIHSLQYIKVRNYDIYMSPQGWEGYGGVNWMIPLMSSVNSTPAPSHWSSEILKLDDKLTHSREHVHTTDKEQKQTIPSEADKATGQVRAGPLLLCYWGVSVFVHVCVCVCLCVCLCLVDYAYVYMPRQRGADEQGDTAVNHGSL